MDAYNLGIKCKIMGYSIYYNPFRHKGSPEQYQQWLLGYNHENP
jgi:hypothetical protein